MCRDGGLNRRELLRLGLAAGAALPLARPLAAAGIAEAAAPPLPAPAPTPAVPATAPASTAAACLDAAERAARWIHGARVETPRGLIWLSGPDRPEGMDSSNDLYSGGAGVVLFLLELARVLRDPARRQEAARGADYLLASLPATLHVDEGESGLYTGVAGVGFALLRAYQQLGDEAYREGARRCRDLIHASAKPAGAGVQWGEVTDVISGAAGTGLYLLHLARDQGDEASRDLAVRAGKRLVELGVAEGGGLKWRMDPTFERLMPNFSHGTAGVAYFLATLHRDTRVPELLAAARAGARYLQSIAVQDGGFCLIRHHEPEDEKLYYLGWCHGPVGTARLWIRLHEIEPEGGWLDWAKRGATAILASGIPEGRTPGFWNNLGQCCGSAGVAAFFLDLAALTGEESYRVFARRMAADLLARATPDGRDGLRWVHAEHRVKPDYTYAQTGYMQGAAGIGVLLLQMAAEESGEPWTLRLPDSPYPTRPSASRSAGP